MKKLIEIEEAAQMVFSLFVLYKFTNPISFYWILILFFVPDLFAIGFLFSNKLGTILYNSSHHKLLAIVLVLLGIFCNQNLLLQVGIITYAHSCFDRAIGYGLKYYGNSSKTHLGFIGKEKHKNSG